MNSTALNSPGYSGPISRFHPAVQEPRIVLRWLARLRWLAVGGQTIAILVAVLFLHLPLPKGMMLGIIALTALSNMGLEVETRRAWTPGWLIPGVLVLDVLLLTALLHWSGGAGNPFSALYLVHVAMAVATLAEGWSWIVVVCTTACYGSLFIWPGPRLPAINPAVNDCADWIALALVSIVIAYFVGRTTRSLRRHERALLDAKELASRNQQLAALTTLAAGAAHELNTPLSTIAVVARELEVQAGRHPEEDSLGQDARLIRQEVDRCQFILSRMRVDVFQEESARPTRVDAERFIAELRRDLDQFDALKIERDPGLRTISLPMRPVQQALTILVDNARDASGPGGVVRLGIWARNGHIVFEVQDQGAGMAPDVVRRAGEPFFTTKPPGKGMGLGLFLARLVAEKMGGSLTLQSEVGRGTRAVIELPQDLKDEDANSDRG